MEDLRGPKKGSICGFGQIVPKKHQLSQKLMVNSRKNPHSSNNSTADSYKKSQKVQAGAQDENGLFL